MMDSLTKVICPVCCEDAPKKIGSRRGDFKMDSEFLFFQCESCWFSFVANPWIEYEKIYSKEYYEGKGADPHTDYWYELNHPERTIRSYEWAGISEIADQLLMGSSSREWLDYGCGNGGLVRYVNNRELANCVGYEEGYIAGESRKLGIPILGSNELPNMRNHFDLVTAIEVIEHVSDPMGFLRDARRLLKKGGKLFLTTGNARPFRGKVHGWSYASVPEVHVSFFEPSTLSLAMKKAGFEPVDGRFMPGFSEVIKFKVLKNLGLKKRSLFFNMLPWFFLSRVVDLRFGVSSHPIGIAV